MADTCGMVYLVGAGPGDPGLLTRRGQWAVSRAEVLVYDRLASWELLSFAPKCCERIYVGKAAGRHSMKQEEINGLLVEKAKEGRLVVRLKGGDPFVFGRGGEEIGKLMEAGIPYEVVPGVTSAVAALADAGIPVTHRKLAQSFHVITGHTAYPAETARDSGSGHDSGAEGTLPDGFPLYAKLSGTLIFLMGLSSLETITKKLIENGKDPDTPAAVVCGGTLPGMRCVRAELSRLPEEARRAGVRSPGIIVVGETAALCFRGEGALPLSGVSVGITGTDSMALRLSERFCALGARTVRAARSDLVPLNEDILSEAAARLSGYDWVVFTSRNAVRIFFEAVRRQKVDYRTLAHLKFAVVGRGTGEFLESFGFFADYMPKIYTTEALAKGLCAAAGKGERLFLPRARQGSKRLAERLLSAGIEVFDLAIYDIETEQAPLSELLGVDYVTFGSASGVRGFFAEDVKEKRELFSTVTPVCIGEVTAAALREYGIGRAVVAGDYTADGVAEAIIKERQDGDICI